MLNTNRNVMMKWQVLQTVRMVGFADKREFASDPPSRRRVEVTEEVN